MHPREPLLPSWALSGASDEEAEPPNEGLTGLHGRGTSSSPSVLGVVYCTAGEQLRPQCRGVTAELSDARSCSEHSGWQCGGCFPPGGVVICLSSLYPTPYSHRPHPLEGAGGGVNDQGWDLGSTISALISHLHLLPSHLIFPRVRAISSSR